MWPWSKIRELQQDLQQISVEYKDAVATAERLRKQLAAKDKMLQTAVLRDPKNGRLLSKRKPAVN